MKLDATRLGVAGGIIWGLSVFLVTFLAMFTGYGVNFLLIVVDLYPWYDLTILGAFIGLVWGFIDGFIGMFLLAWIYNKLGKK